MDLTSIDYDNIDVRDVKYSSPSFDIDVEFVFPLWQQEFLVHMAVPWMAWTRRAMDNLGAQQKQLISNTSLDSCSNVLLELVISSIRMTIEITCIAMGSLEFQQVDRVYSNLIFYWECGPIEISVGA